MAIIYLIITQAVRALLAFIGMFVKKGKLKSFIDGRKQQSFIGSIPRSGKRYWFHCASLGEFEQARPVIEQLKSIDKSNSIVITFFSPSGYEQRANYALADKVLYLPLDTPSNANHLLNHLHVDVAVFVKYEIWYFYLKALHKRKIPTYLLSATFRNNQFIFRIWGKWLFSVMPKFKKIYLQDASSYEVLAARGLTNIEISGDTRFDRVKQNALKVKTNDKIAKFKGDAPMLILGSSWQAEESLAYEFLNDPKFVDFKVLVVPHDISVNHIDDIYFKTKAFGVSKYTEDSEPRGRVLILDTIGHLSSAYHYGDMALIGGAFGKGLHNILEALSFGVPVVFGPNTQKFPEAAMAMQAEVALTISNYSEFQKAVKYFLPEQKLDLNMRAKCIDFINWHSGATDKVIKEIQQS